MKFRLPRKKKKQFKKDCPFSYRWRKNKEDWEWFYFRRRVEVRTMEVVITYPKWNHDEGKYGRYEFDPKLAKPATNEQLLAWYKENYPNDKTAQMYCQQNRHRFDKFNRKVT